MKCIVIIDEKRDEEILIYVRKKTKMIEEIERIADESVSNIFGYYDKVRC